MSTTRSGLRHKITAAMAGLVILGAGGVATQAGFSSTDDIIASAAAGTVNVTLGQGGSTEVAFGDNLAGNTSDDTSVDVVYTGSLGANVTFTIDGIEIEDLDSGVTASGYEVAYATSAEGLDFATPVPLTGDISLDDISMSFAGSDVAQTQELHMRLFVPNDNDAQGDSVAFTLNVLANQA